MVIDLPTFFAVAVPTVAALAWMFRLEGRITVNEARVKAMGEDIAYIRARIDRALADR